MGLNKRDKAILNDLNRFRVMDRDSITELYFQGLKKPENSANNVLKRLHRDGYIERSTNYQPYVYFPVESKMKKLSQKIPHFLKILEIYKDMYCHETPHNFLVEPKYGAKGTVEPDAFCIFKRTPFFIEAQCSVYSDEVIRKKMDRYLALYESGVMNGEPWQPQDRKVFPHVLIISDTRYGLDNDYPFKIMQAQSVDHFLASIKQPKQQRDPQPPRQHPAKPTIKVNV